MTQRPKGLVPFYVVLAVGGLIGTFWFNLHSGGVEGGYLRGWFANAASSSAAVDLLVAATAGSIFIVVEGRRLGIRLAPLYVVGSFLTAFAFTFPLFLAHREVALRRTDATTPHDVVL